MNELITMLTAWLDDRIANAISARMQQTNAYIDAQLIERTQLAVDSRMKNYMREFGFPTDEHINDLIDKADPDDNENFESRVKDVCKEMLDETEFEVRVAR